MPILSPEYSKSKGATHSPSNQLNIGTFLCIHKLLRILPSFVYDEHNSFNSDHCNNVLYDDMCKWFIFQWKIGRKREKKLKPKCCKLSVKEHGEWTQFIYSLVQSMLRCGFRNIQFYSNTDLNSSQIHLIRSPKCEPHILGIFICCSNDISYKIPLMASCFFYTVR